MLRNRRKEKVGRVISNKAHKTITVLIDTKVIHLVYGKFVKTATKFMAHDKDNTCSIGELVSFMETHFLSKKKRWRLVEIIQRAK